MDGLQSWFEFVSQRPGEIADYTIQHAVLVAAVMISAAFVSILVGIAVHQSLAGRSISLSLAGVLITLPSLALFAVFIPIFGLGWTPSFVALFLYALLPILRNTVVGLNQVDPAVLESAKGMGMSPRQTLMKVKLPLAWPVILTGIRVSTLFICGFAAIAKLIGGPGLGHYIREGQTRLGLPLGMERLWTGVVFIVLLALAFDAVYLLLNRLSTPRSLRGRQG
jgi:osmoprotectant transport system permease protein